MKLSSGQRRIRVAIKRFIYSQLYMRDAFLMMFGRAKPFVPFKVEATPPSIYFNFELAPERVPELQQELGLPFPLALIRCVEGEDPFYCLTLNIYRVSGLVNGIRAEWSLYIEDAEGKPRYLVVEAQSDVGSFDSVNLMTRAGEVTHVETDASLDSFASAEAGGHFSSSCRDRTSGPLVRIAPEWVEANDYIYWLSGICDRTFYDSGMANPTARLIDVEKVTIEDTTRWGSMALPEPKHVIAYENAIEFAMSPWWNVEDLPK
jgi:hypothetical protein